MRELAVLDVKGCLGRELRRGGDFLGSGTFIYAFNVDVGAGLLLVLRAAPPRPGAFLPARDLGLPTGDEARVGVPRDDAPDVLCS